MFKKRKGTSGIKGQFYESKLISLIQYRAKFDEKIKEIYLTSNLDQAGAFDDICFKIKTENNRPLIAFIQAKHRENVKYFHLSNNEKLRYFDSYYQIRNKFSRDESEILFNEDFDKVDCAVIIYTNEKCDEEKSRITNDLTRNLDALIATGERGYQLVNTDEDVKLLTEAYLEMEMTKLGKHLWMYLNDEGYKEMMNDKYVFRYHLVLAESVLYITDTRESEYRVFKFRAEFILTPDRFLVKLRDALYEEMYQTRKLNKKEKYLLEFLEKPCEETLLGVIGCTVLYKNGKFEYAASVPIDSRDSRLNTINLPDITIQKSIRKVGKGIMLINNFKFPSTFGNKDLIIRNKDKTERRLDHLALNVANLIEDTRPDNVINIGDNISDGLVSFNGGLSSGIGNILVYDEETRLLKFSNNTEHLENNAKTLLLKLQSKIEDLNDFRIKVSVSKLDKFPKPNIEWGVNDFVLDYLNTIVFYTNQTDENKIDEIFMKEIENVCKLNLKTKSEAIFLKYHYDIQKWWMTLKNAPYLTKETDFFEKAVASVNNESILRILNIIFLNNMKDIGCIYDKTSLHSLQFSHSIKILTENVLLTTIKITQLLNNEDFILLDLNFIFGMLLKEFDNLVEELQEIKETQKIILYCDNFQKLANVNQKLFKIAEVLNGKILIIITNKTSNEKITEIFKEIDCIDDENHRLLDMSTESQNDILKNKNIVFQGEEINLGLIIDKESIKYVEGAVLSSILSNKTVNIGELGINIDNMENYINRKVYQEDLGPEYHEDKEYKDNYLKEKVITTLYDLNESVVLITAMPGMGKSTLLTHLTINTKKIDNKIWIIRINLGEYCRQFFKWRQQNKTIDISTTVTFLCYVVLKNKLKAGHKLNINIDINDNTFNLDGDSVNDEFIKFELNLFLHHFNGGKLFFLFDGFDEIASMYSNEVISVINNIKAERHKIWITSRPYANIKTVLEKNFGKSYVLAYLDYYDQEIYLDKFWPTHFKIDENNHEEIQNLHRFLNFMDSMARTADISKSLYYPMLRVYANFDNYLNVKMPKISKRDTVSTHLIIKTSLDWLICIWKKVAYFKDVIDFIGNPFHLYLMAAYLLNNIKNINNCRDLDINTYTLYEKFLNIKLNIRFQEKNGVDIYIPDNMVIYEKERSEFITQHKMLAAYTIFQTNGLKIFNKKELKRIKKIILTIKKDGEKTGFICHLVNNVPQFVHWTFSVYFALEYLCDKLKMAKDQEMQAMLWNSIKIFETCYDLEAMLEQKSKTDPELVYIIDNVKLINIY